MNSTVAILAQVESSNQSHSSIPNDKHSEVAALDSWTSTVTCRGFLGLDKCLERPDRRWSNASSQHHGTICSDLYVAHRHSQA